MKMSKLIITSLILSMVATLMPASLGVQAAQSEIYNLRIYSYTNRVAMNWYTDDQYISQLHYGESQKYGFKITNDTLSDWHSYEIKGLVPGTRYFYRIVLKDNQNIEVDDTTGEFTTYGQKPNFRLFKPFFYLDFNQNFYSQNNQYPSEILNPQGLKLTEPSIWQGALQVKDEKSHLTYSCNPLFDPSYGTVMAWVRLEKFDKDMVIWQTNDSRYALYFQHGRNWNRIVARAGWDEEKGQVQEAYYYFQTTGTGVGHWQPGEWHLIGMTWEGKIGGTVKLYIDGEKRAEARYTNGGGCTTFMVGNNYRHDMNWSNGQIDDFKLFQWTANSTSMRNEHNAYIVNKQKDLTGQVAGYQVKYFKNGKLLKAPDGKVYVISRDKKIHISDLSALKRYKSHPIINVTWEEINQYGDGGKFYNWSRYPDGTLLKAYDKPGIYWVWNNKAGLISSPSVFKRYGNLWEDVIEISQAELNSYPEGVIYY